MKSVVESVLPCGIPWVIVCCLECACGMWVDWVRAWKDEAKRSSVVGGEVVVVF